MALRSRGGWTIWLFALIGLVLWGGYQLWRVPPGIYDEMGFHFFNGLPVYAVSYFIGLLAPGALAGALVAGIQNLFIWVSAKRKSV